MHPARRRSSGLVEDSGGRRATAPCVPSYRQGLEAIQEAPFPTEAQTRDILYNNAVRFLRLEGAPIG